MSVRAQILGRLIQAGAGAVLRLPAGLRLPEVRMATTAELDTLCAEGDRYAAALAAAGVPVTHKVFPGVDHAFTHREPVEPALAAYALVAEAVGGPGLTGQPEPAAAPA